ncbi:unnamed protein product [Cunninghamella blakesleeana]
MEIKEIKKNDYLRRTLLEAPVSCSVITLANNSIGIADFTFFEAFFSAFTVKEGLDKMSSTRYLGRFFNNKSFDKVGLCTMLIKRVVIRVEAVTDIFNIIDCLLLLIINY